MMGTQSVADTNSISKAVAEIQARAGTFSQPLATERSVITLQVLYVTGTASAWRLIEIVRSRSGSRRRMLCFTSMEDVTRAVEERCAWQRADEQFVATHMATPGGFPGVTADWVPSKDFDLMFGSSREAIRRQMCLTSPDHTVTLA